jgi:hypothetical protein
MQAYNLSANTPIPSFISPPLVVMLKKIVSLFSNWVSRNKKLLGRHVAGAQRHTFRAPMGCRSQQLQTFGF